MRLFVIFLPALTAAGAITPAGSLPVAFEPNRGQFDSRVRFGGRGSGFQVAITASGAEFSSKRAKLSWRLIGSNPGPRLTGKRPQPGVANYLAGPRHRWIRNVPTFGAVHCENVWSGIDLLYYGNPDRLEYDFIVRPGADPDHIQLKFDLPITLATDGGLLAGTLRWKRPVAHQGGRQVAVSYRLRAGKIGFEIGAYDRSQPLVIDPVLAFSSMLGGNGLDLGNAVAVDLAGNLYVVGNTDSRNFPITSGAARGSMDVFVSKLNPTGTTLIYSTYIGGALEDRGRNIAVDNGGNVYVAGETSSTNFPVTGGALQTTFRGGPFDAFAFKLNAAGTDLVYATYLGGGGEDSGFGVKIDAVGNAYVSGITASNNFPVTAGVLRPAFAGGAYDLFITKLNPAGTAAVYSTYLGGAGREVTDANLAIDAAGNVYVTGETGSLDFPTTPNAFQPMLSGVSDAFASKLNPAGTALVYSTRIGGNAADTGLGIAVDAAGSAYVSGTTFSRNFPPGSTPLQPAFGGGESDGFVVKLNAAGTALNYSTYLGGTSNEDAWAIAVDSGGIAHVVGTTTSPNFPVTQDALQTTYGGGDGDVFYARINATGSALAYSTYFGWTGFDEGFNLTLDASRNVYLIGAVDAGFPTTPGAVRTTHGGGEGDAFVARISEDQGPVEGPRISAQGVVNAAGYTGGGVAPGEMVTIFGQNLGPATLTELKLASTTRVDTNLGVTRVLFDNTEAPLVYVFAEYIAAVVPYEVAGRPATNLVVIHRGMRSNIANVPVVQAAPGIYTLNSQGFGQAAIRNQDNSVNGPSNPADRGSIVSIFATGGGQTNPPGVTGAVAAGLSNQALPVTVDIGGNRAELLYSGNAPGLVSGVLQLNARVPVDLVPGIVAVTVTVGGVATQPNVTMAIR
jgi:uncharacterized protein (TIGR03437 family)